MGSVVKLRRQQRADVGVTRPIKSVYYFRREIVRKNSASNPLRCTSRCVEHLRLDSYGATHVEVFDETTGTLHAVVKRDMQGNIHILYERELVKTEVM